ncbi:probable serine incorporator isoform X2 [Phalaenopsis equestris]|uniref:probable serine incorporator isoform X2 n=1 Tax=Phalaenopsis equestris TaxID=78828 RepID=UPI0009E572C2|nr:probable serine incorporator isoform X2 [Phalaenopsis equestris]
MTNISIAIEDLGYSKKNSWFTRLFLCPNPYIARYIYAFIFFITSLLAWTVRDYGHTVLSELHRLKGCHGASYCLGTEGVLRISFGCFMYFSVLFVTTVGTKKIWDARNSWHCEWWLAKMLMWMLFMLVPFFMPSEFFFIYGKLAHVGAGTFLVIQLISVISFINWLNDCFHSEKYAERCHIQVMIISIVAYVASIVGCIMMYVWYASKLSCRLNILFITLTLLLLQIMTFVSMHPKVRAGYLSPGLMGAYIVFLCWCGIRSEPQTEICNQKVELGNGSDWLTIVSLVIAILVIVVATFSTGMNSKCLQFVKIERNSEDEVPYGYGFFHFVFAIGSMYFGMLFIGWNVHKTMQNMDEACTASQEKENRNNMKMF